MAEGARRRRRSGARPRRSREELTPFVLSALPRLRDAGRPEGDEAARGRVAARPAAPDREREARARRHPRRRVLGAGAAAHPRRQGPAAARARHARRARDASPTPATRPAEQTAALAAAYRFLRDVEHKLQIVHERQTQIIPTTPTSCARWCAGSASSGADGEAEFWRRARARTPARWTRRSRRCSTAPEEERRRDERPELATLMDSLDHEEQALWQLGQLGFRDLEAAYARPAPAARRAAVRAGVAAPARGAGRARAEPGRRDRRLGGARTARCTTWRASSPPSARARAISTCCSRTRASGGCWSGSSPPASSCPASSCAIPSCSTAWCAPISCGSRARATTSRASSPRGSAPRRTSSPSSTSCAASAHEEFLRIGVHDIQGELRPPDVSAQLSALADVCLAQALGLALARRDAAARRCRPSRPTRRARGRSRWASSAARSSTTTPTSTSSSSTTRATPTWWHERIAPHEFFTRVAQRTISVLQTPTREGVAYRIDTRLRPSGNQGPLVSSLDAFEAYQRTSAAALGAAGAHQGAARSRARRRSARGSKRRSTQFVYGRGLDAAEVRRDAPDARAHRGRARRRRRAARQHQDRPRRPGRRRVRRADAPAPARPCASHGCARGGRVRRSPRSRRPASCRRTTPARCARATTSCARSRAGCASSAISRSKRSTPTPTRCSASLAGWATRGRTRRRWRRCAPTTRAIARRSATRTIGRSPTRPDRRAGPPPARARRAAVED